MTHDITRRPNRIPWPPILYLAAILAAFALEAVRSVRNLFESISVWLRVTSVLIACLGLGLDLAAMHAMRHSRTNILPHRGTDHLVSDGVFAFSRNPIYLGNTVLLAGLALTLAWPWLLATTAVAVAVVLVDHLAIRREERHLTACFGPAFTQYAQRVPRWFGFHHRGDDDHTHPRLIDPRKHRK